MTLNPSYGKKKNKLALISVDTGGCIQLILGTDVSKRSQGYVVTKRTNMYDIARFLQHSHVHHTGQM